MRATAPLKRFQPLATPVPLLPSDGGPHGWPRRGLPLEVISANSDSVPHASRSRLGRRPLRRGLVQHGRRPLPRWVDPDWVPTIIDLMDLEDVKGAASGRTFCEPSDRQRAPFVGPAVTAATSRRTERQDWQSFQRSVASEVERVDSLQRRRRPSIRHFQVPLRSRTPIHDRRATSGPTVGDRARVLLQGSLRDAGPNID